MVTETRNLTMVYVTETRDLTMMCVTETRDPIMMCVTEIDGHPQIGGGTLTAITRTPAP